MIDTKYITPRVNRIELPSADGRGKVVTYEYLDSGITEIFEFDINDQLVAFNCNDGRWQKIYRHENGRAYRYEDSAGNVEVIDYREGHVVHRLTDKAGNVEYWVEDEND